MTTLAPPSSLSWKFARLTAPLTRVLAGRRYFPGWAVVHHRGRKTGRALTVPIALVATPEVFLVNLPWGAGTNWVRNVEAAGGCVVRWKGVDHAVDSPEILGEAAARPYYGRISWAIARRMFPADAWLLLHRRDGS